MCQPTNNNPNHAHCVAAIYHATESGRAKPCQNISFNIDMSTLVHLRPTAMAPMPATPTKKGKESHKNGRQFGAKNEADEVAIAQ